METIKNIDQDVESLHQELDRHDGKRSFHCNRRCKYILGIVGLLLLMFVFGALTRPAQKNIVVAEVPATLDSLAPRVVQPEINVRLLALYERSKAPSAHILVPTLPSQGTVPRIISWSPSAIGKVNTDGTVVPVTGTYEAPPGWFGSVRLVSDGKEIGAVTIDARANTVTSQGSFIIIPIREEGQHLARLVFDVVKACRITCASDNQFCLATNANYCVAQQDNQAFLSYAPTLADATPPQGQCTTKTFVAGPKYAPQIPEDYTMCERGMWNTNPVMDAGKWMAQNIGDRVPRSTGQAFTQSAFTQFQSQDFREGGRVDNVSWSFESHPGVAGSEICSVAFTVNVDCKDGEIKQESVPSKTTSFLNSTLESLLSLTLPKVAHAAGGCDGWIRADFGFGLSPFYVGPTVVADSAACVQYVNDMAAMFPPDGVYQSSNFTAIPPSLCGNGVINGTEQCDGGNLNGASCPSLGYAGGTLSCSASCTFDTSACASVFLPPSSMCGIHCMGDAGVSACIAADMIIDPFPDAYGYCNVCGGSVMPCGGGGFPACGTPDSGWTWAMIIVPDDSYACTPPPPACSDGLDNDGDFRRDFGVAATNDHGCTSSTDNDESTISLPGMSCSGGLLPNWNFEDTSSYMTNWTKGPGTYLNRKWQADGNYGASIEGGETLVSQAIPATPGVTYNLTFWGGTHDASLDQTGKLVFRDNTNTVIANQLAQIDYIVDGDWSTPYIQQYAVGRVAPPGTVSVEAWARNAGPAGTTMKFDGACLTASAAPVVTVSAAAIRCSNEADLPNWGSTAVNPDITNTTASNWVAGHPSCSFDPGWRFEWWYNDNNLFGNVPAGLIGLAGTGNVSALTLASGNISQAINYPGGTTSIWLRQVLRAGDLPFTNQPPSGNDTNPSSAEFYCDQDVQHYDNLEYLGSPVIGSGATYYCVAWNAPSGGAVNISVTPSLSYGAIPVGTSKILPVTITHTGGGPVAGVFVPPNIGAAGTYACQGNPSCSFTVSAVSPTVTLNIILTAAQVAPLGGVANIVSNAPQQNITITGMGDDKAILDVESIADGVWIPTDSPSPFDVLPFGNISQAGASMQRQFTVKNMGATPLSYVVDPVAGPNSIYYSCSGSCVGAGMINGQTQTFTITFNPNPVGGTVGDKSASVNVRNISGVQGGVTPIGLNFQANIISNQAVFQVFPGVNPAPNVTVSPIAGGFEVDFGSIPVFSTRSRDIIFYNDGDIPMDVSYLASAILPFIHGAGNQPNIPAGSSHTLSVDFNPQVAGPVSQDHIVTTNGYAGGTVIVRLRGDAYTQPALDFTGDAGTFTWGGTGNLNFGSLDVNASPIFLTIDIQNTGSAPTTVSFAGGEVSYTVVPVTTNSIPAGQTRSFRVYFDPAPGGPYPEAHSGTIIVSATGLPGTSQVFANGSGTITPFGITIDQALNFGKVIVGKTKTITTNIRNNDTLGRGFGSPDMVVNPLGIFTCTAGCTPNPLLNWNDVRSITISFTPTAVQGYVSNLDFNDGGVLSGNWFTIPITGQGIRPTIKYEEN